jgi:hypothetical protein
LRRILSRYRNSDVLFFPIDIFFFNEYADMSDEEQDKRGDLMVDCARMPSDPRARI